MATNDIRHYCAKHHTSRRNATPTKHMFAFSDSRCNCACILSSSQQPQTSQHNSNRWYGPALLNRKVLRRRRLQVTWL